MKRRVDLTYITKIIFPLLSIVMGLLIAFLLAEAVVRIGGFAPGLVNQYGGNVADPHLPFKPKPNSKSKGMSGSKEYRYENRHNSVGFRDVEHSLKKEDGVFRILGLGDSFTYGVGADFESTYLYQLEVLLNAREGDHPRVEIIKAGIARYFAEPEKRLLRHYGLAYEPDLVTVGFLPNDIIDAHLGMGAVRVDKSGYLRSREAEVIGDVGTWLFTHSHFFRMVLKIYIEGRIAAKYQTSWPEIWIPDGMHEKDWQETEAQYSEMATMISSDGGSLIIINIPQNGPWTKEDLYPGTRLSNWAKKSGVGFVDVLPEMIRTAKSSSLPLYYPKDGHCTNAGYSVIARTVFNHLVQNQLVP